MVLNQPRLGSGPGGGCGEREGRTSAAAPPPPGQAHTTTAATASQGLLRIRRSAGHTSTHTHIPRERATSVQ